MSNVNVAYDELTNAANALTSGQSDIETQLGQLQSAINTLVSEGFKTDSASGQFESAYTEFTNGAKATIEGLTGMATFLKTAAASFHDTDTTLAAGIPQ